MADFCKECSIDLFLTDFEELAKLCNEGEIVSVICEGCGFIDVDATGKCQGCEIHPVIQPIGK